MTTFTIDNENTITALAGATTTGADPTFSSHKELEALATNWPISRLVETWNGFAGAPPLGDLKPVKKFENKTKATRRIWEAIQKLAGEPRIDVVYTDVAAAPAAKPAKQPKGKAKTPAAKPAKAPKTAPKGKGEKVTAKAAVIAMISKKGGATLEEIMKATGWQPHTTRGFICILGKKDGLKINSTRRESDKARVYEIAR